LQKRPVFKKPANRSHPIGRETEDVLFYRALLQKRPVILRNPLIVATPWEEKQQMYRDGDLF